MISESDEIIFHCLVKRRGDRGGTIHLNKNQMKMLRCKEDQELKILVKLIPEGKNE